MHRRLGRSPIAALATIALALAMVFAGLAPAGAGRGSGGGGPAPTPPPSPTTFTRVFSAQDNGGIRMFGNSNMTCDNSQTRCAQAQAGTPGLTLSSYNNNAYVMQWIDLDSDGSTVNSTSADLEIPSGSTILRAQLVWGGNTGSGRVNDPASVQLAVGSGAYQTINASPYPGQQASPIWSSGGFYQASADVTSIVRANPTGTYWVGNIASIPNVGNKFAGWSLVVAYRNPGDPIRDLTINLGLDQISGSDNTQINVSGFLTPLTGAVNASVGLVAWEGDLGIIGDESSLEGTRLSNANHPSTNFFDSSVSDPTVTAARNPDYVNGMGVDVARVDASNIIDNGATSANLLLSTSGDAYAPGVVTTQVDLYAPAFASITKSVVNLNGHEPAWPGDTLEYQISLANTGGDSSEQTVLTDAIPDGTTYVPGSIAYLPSTSTPTTQARTDAAGDDAAEYTAGTIVARLGTGATSSTGGTLAPLASAAVRFRVTVDAGLPSGTEIGNEATVDYLSPAINKTFRYYTNAVATTTEPVADLRVVKTALGNPSTDNPITYQVSVTNNGPAAATGVVLQDTMPTPTFSPSSTPISGLSVQADPTLTGAAGTCTRASMTGPDTNTYWPSFTCDIPALASGESVVVEYQATVYGANGDPALNTASVSADQTDPLEANNSTTETSPRPGVTDLWNRGTPNPGRYNGLTTAGQVFPYQMEVVTLDYQGYATAQDVVASLELPLGFSYVPDSSSDPVCTQTGQLLECPVGPVAPGPAPGYNWTVSILPDPSLAPGSYPFVSRTTTSTPDINLSNNVLNGSFDLLTSGWASYVNDLAVTETLNGDIVAGGTANYTISAVNNGPSTAYNAVVAQPTPPGYMIDSFGTDHGSCEVVSGDLQCTFDALAPNDPVSINVVYQVDPSLGSDDTPTSVTVTATASEDATYGQTDRDDTNDIGSATGPVVRRADLSLVKTQENYAFAWGELTYFWFTVANTGPSDANAVVITDTLPAYMELGASPPAGCEVTTPATGTAGDVVECTLSSPVTAGGSVAIRVPIQTRAEGAGSSATNVAGVDSSTPDPEPGNNTPATTVSTAVQSADLSITKQVSDLTPTPGVPFSYTITVTNNGPSDAHADWSVTDTLPTGVSFVSAVGDLCSAGDTPGEVNCATGAVLAATSTQAFTFTVLAAPSQTGHITNTAAVDPGLVDANYDDESRNNNTTSVGADLAPLADLTMAINLDAGAHPAGTEFAGSLVVTNAGPSRASSPVITLRMPAGVRITPTVDYPAGYTCTQAGQLVSCTVPPVDPSVPVTLPVTVALDPAIRPATLTLNGSVGTTTAESDLTNNAATASTSVYNNASLSIAKSGPEVPFAAGSQAEYAIVVSNTGDSDALPITGGYVVTDTVPDGLTILSASMPGATCTVSAQTVTCTLARLAGGGSATMTIGVLVGTSIDPGGVTNTASLDYTTEGPNHVESSATTPVQASSHLSVTKAADRDLVAVGGSVVYSIVVANDGPSVAPAVMFTDDLPAGLAVLGTGVRTDVGTCTGADGATTVSCSLGDLPAGGHATITIQARVPESAPSGLTITNTATVTDERGDTPASGSVQVTTEQAADLAVVKYATSDIPVAGLEQSYVISAVNNGPSTAAGVVVTDALPPGTTLVSAQTPSGTCTQTGTDLSCDLGDLVKGQVATIALNLLLGADLGGTDLTNTARIASQTTDPAAGDNESSVTQEVQALSAFEMTKEITSGLVNGNVPAGGQVTYTITATNHGPSDALNAWILDRVPVDTNGDPLAVYVSSTIDGPVGTCEFVTVYDDTPGADPSVITDEYYQCTYGTLPVGETMTMTFTIDVNDNAGGELPNWAWGGAQNNTENYIQPAPGVENSPYATARNSIDGPADLSLQIDAPLEGTPGEPVDVAVTVSNAGPSTVNQPWVDLTLPAGTSFESATGATCTPITGGVRCTTDPLASAGQAAFTIRLTSDPAATGSATISGLAGGTDLDPDTGNNSASDSLTWIPAATLAIVKTATPDPATPGGDVTYTVTVTNQGPSTARQVELTDDLPAGVLSATATSTPGTCAITGLQVTCTADQLSVGEAFTASIVASIDPAATAELANTATVTSEASTATDSAVVRTALVPTVELTLTNSPSPSSVAPGDQVEFTLVAGNNGPSLARSAMLVFPLPTGLSVVDGTVRTSQGTCTVQGGTVTCTLGDLGVGETVTVRVGALVGTGVTSGSLATVARLWSAESSSETATTAGSTLAVTSPEPGTPTPTPTATPTPTPVTSTGSSGTGTSTSGSLAWTGSEAARLAWLGVILLVTGSGLMMSGRRMLRRHR
ncbi:MAG: hypothetical protein ACK5MT_22270 [Actinomycetales bacterium]